MGYTCVRFGRTMAQDCYGRGVAYRSAVVEDVTCCRGDAAFREDVRLEIWTTCQGETEPAHKVYPKVRLQSHLEPCTMEWKARQFTV